MRRGTGGYVCGLLSCSACSRSFCSKLQYRKYVQLAENECFCGLAGTQGLSPNCMAFKRSAVYPAYLPQTCGRQRARSRRGCSGFIRRTTCREALKTCGFQGLPFRGAFRQSGGRLLFVLGSGPCTFPAGACPSRLSASFGGPAEALFLPRQGRGISRQSGRETPAPRCAARKSGPAAAPPA